jgi:hypothetical protein
MCDIGDEPHPCPGLVERDLGCRPCSEIDKPFHAVYISNNMQYEPPLYCLWECEEDFFALGSTCESCTKRNETNCPHGMVAQECTSSQDFTCSVPCVNSTKPVGYSFWMNNCTWSCISGHEAYQTPGGTWFCRLM